MTLADLVRQKLADTPPKVGRHDLVIADEAVPGSVSLVLERHDELGCLIVELNLRRTNAPAGETLRSWGDRIAGRATGLLESLKIVEIDSERNEALLRSESPSRRKDKATYYEVLLQGTTQARVRRYETADDRLGKREQIAFVLTHETLAKFAEDLSAAK